MSRRFPGMRFVGVAAGAALAAGFAILPLPTAARASTSFHLRLVRAEPAVRSTVVGSPATISLWFSEPVRIKSTSIKITNGAGTAITLGPLARDTAAKAPVVAKVTQTIAPGRYLVSWRAMGHDSHVVKDTFSFTVAAPKSKTGR